MAQRTLAQYPASVICVSTFTPVAPLVLFVVAGVMQAGDWPQWHGPGRDRHLPAGDHLPSRLPQEYRPVWKISVGGGHASPVVAGGRLVYLDEDGAQEVAHCLEAATGRELWRTPYADRLVDEWGAGPRSTPFLDGDRVYAQSCKGEFRCLSLADGRVLWGVSFERDFGVRFLGRSPGEGNARRRGNNGAGIVDGDAVIVPVGSTNGACLVCFDKRTGKVLWRAGSEEVAYSSLVIASVAGTRQVVAFTADSLMGVECLTGQVLWRVPLKTAAQRHAATPVITGDNVVVSSHTFGMTCVHISKDSTGFHATERWLNSDLKVNLATATLVDGFLYGQGAGRDYVCVDAADGRMRWSQSGFGEGMRDYASTLAAGRCLLVLTEAGTLLLLEASPERYLELGRLDVCGRTWTFPAYADGRLYVRDARQLLCLDLAGQD